MRRKLRFSRKLTNIDYIRLFIYLLRNYFSLHKFKKKKIRRFYINFLLFCFKYKKSNIFIKKFITS